jgi:hypothetical protein
MGNNRKKRTGPVNNNTKISVSTTNTTTNAPVPSVLKPDEAAASSMSSESSAELMVSVVTTGVARMMKGATTNTTTTKNIHHHNTLLSNRNHESSLLLWDNNNNNNNEHQYHTTPQQTFRFSWNEILALFFMLLSFAIGSIIVGVAAGVSISIHYYESPENLDQRRLAATLPNHRRHRQHHLSLWDENGGQSGGVHTPTITSIDPTMVTYSQHYYPIPEERVVHTDASTGMKIALNVVVESPSLLLSSTTTTITTSSPSNDTQSVGIDYNDNDSHSYNHNRYDRNQGETFTPPPPPNSGRENFDIWLHTPPKLCSDHQTMGYDSWTSLRHALNDINRYSAQQSDRWIIYFATLATSKSTSSSSYNRYQTTSTTYNPSSFSQRILPTFDDDSLYYEEQFVLNICPGTFLKAGSYPLIIDTGSVTLQCDGCTISGGDSHISFGSSAKNTIIRGITFQNSVRSSSMVLPQDGAEVTFQDCIWVVRYLEIDQSKRYILPGLNEIANVNSNSIVNFYRCSTIPQKLSRFFLFHWWSSTND